MNTTVFQPTNQTTTLREDDLIQHIEDSRLYWVYRHGPVQITWNEATHLERQWLLEASERDVYNVQFSPCGEW